MKPHSHSPYNNPLNHYICSQKKRYMIKKLKYAIIADIGNFNPMHNDAEKEAELIAYCNKNGFTYLPSKSKKSVYKLENNHFVRRGIDDVVKVNAFDLIFDQRTIQKFEEPNHNEVRFIVENNEIKGVVHIVDYNNAFISVELYKALFQFESNLRQLLIDNDLSNEDFISWVWDEATKTNNDYWHRKLETLEYRREQMSYANLFQTFNFRDLLLFAKEKKLIELSNREIDNISDIRNSVAHNKDVTSHSDENGMIVYDFEGLDIFLEQMNSFFQSYELLADKVNE